MLFHIETLAELSTSQLKAILPLFSRAELRELAKECNIKQRRLKSDFINNILSIRNRSKLEPFTVEVVIY